MCELNTPLSVSHLTLAADITRQFLVVESKYSAFILTFKPGGLIKCAM